MSWLSKGLKKGAKQIENNFFHNPVAEAGKKIGKKIEKGISKIVPHVHSAERRQAMQAAKEQIDYYKTAKEELTNQRNANDTQKKMERQRINEKEIRARQRTYRRAGFMEQPATTPTETLG